MSQAKHSLKRRLFIWLSVPLSVIAITLLIDAYYSARISVNNAYDRTLYGSALAIAERVVVDDGQLLVDLPYIALEMLSSTSLGNEHIYYKVIDDKGRLITGYGGLPDYPNVFALESDGNIFFDAYYRDQPVRITVLARELYHRAGRYGFAVYVAETTNERARLASSAMLGSAIRLLVIIGLAVIIAWFSVWQGLKPLSKLQQSLSRRAYNDLQPLTEKVPEELSKVVAAINQLMRRLDQSFIDMQAFVNDASHQLRTPLATLQTQVELALTETESKKIHAELQTLLNSTRRISRLAQQLLSHAKAINANDNTELDLNQLATCVTGDWITKALGKNIDLGFERAREAAYVFGSPSLLREMLNNLIGNALKYSGDGAYVTVRIRHDESSIVLEVDDNGPGVPEAERDNVFRRFYRLPGKDEDGCGLGLAIVKAIADLHNAAIELDEGYQGRGLCVRIKFPGVKAKK